MSGVGFRLRLRATLEGTEQLCERTWAQWESVAKESADLLALIGRSVIAYEFTLRIHLAYLTHVKRNCAQHCRDATIAFHAASSSTCRLGPIGSIATLMTTLHPWRSLPCPHFPVLQPASHDMAKPAFSHRR